MKARRYNLRSQTSSPERDKDNGGNANERNVKGGGQKNELKKIIKSQQSHCSNGNRPISPIQSIPLCYCVGDQPDYISDWIKRQERKAIHESQIDISFYNDAQTMINDGTAKMLVEGGYNVFGDKLKSGRNFFDKALDQGYEMYDLVPAWANDIDSGVYSPQKKQRINDNS